MCEKMFFNVKRAVAMVPPGQQLKILRKKLKEVLKYNLKQMETLTQLETAFIFQQNSFDIGILCGFIKHLLFYS